MIIRLQHTGKMTSLEVKMEAAKQKPYMRGLQILSNEAHVPVRCNDSPC